MGQRQKNWKKNHW